MNLKTKLQITSENYFSLEAGKEYLSVSQYKEFIACEAKAAARMNGEYSQKSDSEALLFGSLFHAWNEGEKAFNSFLKEHPALFSTRGATKGQLKAAYIKVYDLIERAERDNIITKALNGKKEVIFTAEMFGIWWKICIDSYNPELGYFADLKSMADITSKYYCSNTKSYVNFINYYKYNYQMVVYSEIEKLATGRETNLNPLLVVLTKQIPPDTGIFKGFLDYKEQVLNDIEQHIPRIIDLKAGIVEPNQCGRCDYCRKVKKTKVYHIDEYTV